MRDENEAGVDNRPAIALETRRQLRRCINLGWLDEPSIGLVERVLDASRPGSLSLFTYELALDLGATVESALRAASAAELLYAAIDFTDDVEDGDESDSLPDVSHPVCVNTAAHMFVLAWRAIAELDASLSVSIASLVSGMFSAQRHELTREDWCRAGYERVGRANGGMQLETYVRLAAHAAAVAYEPLVKPLGAIGILMQIASDEPKGDERLLSIPEAERRSMREDVQRELELGLDGLSGMVERRLRTLVRS